MPPRVNICLSGSQVSPSFMNGAVPNSVKLSMSFETPISFCSPAAPAELLISIKPAIELIAPPSCLTLELFDKSDTTDPKFETEPAKLLTAAKAVSTLFNPFCILFKTSPTEPLAKLPLFKLPGSVAISNGKRIRY